MASADTLLRTHQVASALGVSVSTIKRWVDSGLLRASRTVGGHRLIPLSEALRLARQQGLPDAKLELLAGAGVRQLDGIDDRLRDALAAALREGRGREARLLIHSAYASGRSAAALADQLVQPVLERIGHGWQVGALDVFQEHEATHLVASALAELIERAARSQSPTDPLAIGAAPEGDPYVLAGLLGELVLREEGWNVRHLGVNLPLRSLANAVAALRPRLVFLTVNYLADRERFVREYRPFYEAATLAEAAVIVGGQALGPEVRAELVYASFGDRMAHLAEFARRLRPASGGGGARAADTDRFGRSRFGEPQEPASN